MPTFYDLYPLQGCDRGDEGDAVVDPGALIGLGDLSQGQGSACYYPREKSSTHGTAAGKRDVCTANA